MRPEGFTWDPRGCVFNLGLLLRSVLFLIKKRQVGIPQRGQKAGEGGGLGPSEAQRVLAGSAHLPTFPQAAAAGPCLLVSVPTSLLASRRPR